MFSEYQCKSIIWPLSTFIYGAKFLITNLCLLVQNIYALQVHNLNVKFTGLHAQI